jgi:GT2 family glycosyltransferase
VSVRPKIVLLGMMTKIPVAGVVWQTLHYLIGLRRLGFEPYYVEAHARTPGMLMREASDDSGLLAASFIRDNLARFGLERNWAYQALHDDGRLYGLGAAELKRLFVSAELIVNLHGGTEPRPEHYETGRLVYLETDPVQLQVELHEERQSTIDFLAPHVAFFTFGENYGRPGCGLPVTDRFAFHPTRQPVVTDLWLGAADGVGQYTTVGNWQQNWRDVTLDGERYGWSKDQEFRKLLALPARTEASLELALASFTPQDRELLESRGFAVRNALELSTEIDVYREYIRGSRAEFTVAKEQNVRLHTGWFSDRSATYLAAGRPVVTQDTGFGCALPIGDGLFAFGTIDEAVAAVETIEADYPKARRAAFEIAREHFDAEVVLGQLLETVGLTLPGHRRRVAEVPATVDLVPAARRPTRLAEQTLDAILSRPLPDTGGDRLGRRRHDASIVVVAPDGLAFTRLCVESVLSDHGVDAELIVVDNASADGTREFLAALAERDARVRVIRNDENRAYAAALNQGLAESSGDVLVVLNNDVVVPSGALARLIAHLERPEIGLVGPSTNRSGNEAEIDVTYRRYAEMTQLATTRAAEHDGAAFDIEVATLFCAAVRRDVFERVGPLDERFEVGLFEDDDYSARIREAGLRVVCAEDAFVHHFGEGSFGALVPSGRYGELFRANKQRFEEKWGVEWHSHLRRPRGWYRDLVEEIRAVVDRVLPDDATVLVVSNGDDELLDLPSARRGWHFPQMDDGTYAGYHPGTSTEALSHLQVLVARGAQYLVFPSTTSWWLDYYAELASELRAHADHVIVASDACTIFELAATRQEAGANA